MRMFIWGWRLLFKFYENSQEVMSHMNFIWISLKPSRKFLMKLFPCKFYEAQLTVVWLLNHPVHIYSNLILCVLVLRRSVFYHTQPTALWIPTLFLPSVPPLLKPGELNYNWHLWYTDKINLHPDNRLWCTDLVPVQLPSLPAPFSDDQWIHTTPRGLPLASQTVPPNWHISGGYRNKA